MRIQFTKMHGAGNDFVVLDETRQRYPLTAAHYRLLADRHFGVGADQLLSVRPSPAPGIDFEYIIHNADGGEVEQCGNGARCFAQFVREKGLSTKSQLKVKTQKGVIQPFIADDGRITVDMGMPVFEHSELPFNSEGLQPQAVGDFELWPLAWPGGDAQVDIAAVSMGNPHAVQRVDDVDTAPVATMGAFIESHERFVRRVNVGFMQVVTRSHIRLRVYERGAGETLACGTGTCAAVVAGIRLGWLDKHVDVDARGGRLSIAWEGMGHPVLLTGPAATVFDAEIELPDIL